MAPVRGPLFHYYIGALSYLAEIGRPYPILVRRETAKQKRMTTHQQSFVVTTPNPEKVEKEWSKDKDPNRPNAGMTLNQRIFRVTWIAENT